MRLADRLRPLARYEPWVVLGPLVLAQWLCLVAFVLTVRHNGWLFYQGGDQTFFYTSSWVLGHGHIPESYIGFAWSYLLAPLTWVFGSNVVAALPAIVLLQTLVLLPAGLLACYGIGARIGGRVIGYLAAGLWVFVPYALIPLWDHRYHARYVEQFLPQALGLTGLGDFPSTICLLVSAYLFVRALDSRAPVDAALAGLGAGFAIGIKPANALYLAGVVVGFLLAPRWRQVVAFGAGAALPLLALVLWKGKGLGHIPLLAAPRVALAVGAAVVGVPVVASISHYLQIDWHQLRQNDDSLRESFWTVRIVEWFAFAGFVMVARQSLAKAGFLLGWFLAFALVKGSSPYATIEAGSFLRLFMPGFAPFFLAIAAIPLLVPRYGPRLAERFPAVSALPAWPTRLRSRSVLAAAAVFGLLPVLFLSAFPPLRGRSTTKYFANHVFIPVADGLKPHLAGGRLQWSAPAHPGTGVFYRVMRSRPLVPAPDPSDPPARQGIRCYTGAGTGAADCRLEMDVIGTTRATSWPVAPAGGPFTYRIALAGNWLNDPARGDVLLVGAPLTVRSGRVTALGG